MRLCAVMQQGKWLWSLKDYIDRSFMRKYSDDLPDMMMMAGGLQLRAEVQAHFVGMESMPDMPGHTISSRACEREAALDLGHGWFRDWP